MPIPDALLLKHAIKIHFLTVSRNAIRGNINDFEKRKNKLVANVNLMEGICKLTGLSIANSDSNTIWFSF